MSLLLQGHYCVSAVYCHRSRLQRHTVRKLQQAHPGVLQRATCRVCMSELALYCTCGALLAATCVTGMAVHAGDFFKFKDEGGPFDIGYDYT